MRQCATLQDRVLHGLLVNDGYGHIVSVAEAD